MPQRAGEGGSQRGCWVGRVQEESVGANRLNLRVCRGSGWQTLGMKRQPLDGLPERRPLRYGRLGLLPVGDPGFESGGVVLERNKLRVPNQLLYVLNVLCRGHTGQWRGAAGLRRQGQQRTDELRSLDDFFTRFAWDVHHLVELADGKPLAYGQCGFFDAKLRLGNLVLVELPCNHGNPVQRGRQMLAAVESDQAGVDCIARPAKLTGFQFLAYLRAGDRKSVV